VYNNGEREREKVSEVKGRNINPRVYMCVGNVRGLVVKTYFCVCVFVSSSKAKRRFCVFLLVV